MTIGKNRALRGKLLFAAGIAFGRGTIDNSCLGGLHRLFINGLSHTSIKVSTYLFRSSLEDQTAGSMGVQGKDLSTLLIKCFYARGTYRGKLSLLTIVFLYLTRDCYLKRSKCRGLEF